MASYSVAHSKHATLTAATVDTVTLTQNYRQVEVKNRDASLVVYFTANGNTPTVAGDNTEVVSAGESVIVDTDTASDVIKLISSGAAAYSVTGVE
jgi:hypothetical protein